MGGAQEADEVHRADPEEDSERRELGEESPQTGGECLDMEAARLPRPLPQEGLAVEKGKEGAEREGGQHQGT